VFSCGSVKEQRELWDSKLILLGALVMILCLGISGFSERGVEGWGCLLSEVCSAAVIKGERI
jgi:hypothetical protein